jgi:two-component system chemotaxis sensor kinase CheA
MGKILSTLLLPAEITAFERRYLARMNRIGLGFFALHVPALVLLAYFNDTGPLLAAILATAVVAGPALAYKAFASPRFMSLTYGFTAMLMGGLLVHFGQGPVQIEMHFYFFALLAMLVLFGNPMSIVVAAVTVALHHLILWIIVPSSVFNYDAPVWVVAVHAAFVVLEAIAACFIARSFFDNVIGLEKIVAERTAAMRVVLDNVQQGLVTIDLDAVISDERSAAVERWLGPIAPGTRMGELLARSDASAGAWFDVGWPEVVEGAMPLELTLAQLPSRFVASGRSFEIAYTPIFAAADGGRLERTMLVITDITEALARERLEAGQRELLTMFNRLMHDRRGVAEFLDEGDALVERIGDARQIDMVALKRSLHTLKGNAGIFGVGSIAAVCHELETTLDQTNEPPRPAVLEALLERWRAMRADLRPLLGDGGAGSLEIDDASMARLVAAIRSGQPADALLAELESWRMEPTSLRFERIADQARRIAARLGKTGLDVVIEHNDVRLAPEPWAAFWAAFIHVVRNAVDHGIESAATRASRGKPARGRITLASSVQDGVVVIAIEDDGAGIDLGAIAASATRLGLDVSEKDTRIAAIFHDGVTTATEVGELSGRGVGMGAMQAACAAMGGTTVVTSEPGRFTRVELRIPAVGLAARVQLAA